MTYRAANGRFRKPTDEERWPNPTERERIQRIRGYFGLAKAEWLRVMDQQLRDIQALEGTVWKELR